MSYLVLARKYRPKQFSDIVGQQSVVRTIVNAIKLKRTHQAYVFSGSRGIGKTSIARIFSKALRCPNVVEKEDGLLYSCDHCSDCLEIASGNSVNVLEIDGASNNGVDSVREIRENAKFLPSSGLYKIYIIDEVHMLSTAAFNALLKTLEEPPEHVVFIFATTESHKIPETILGRCQRFDFKRVTIVQIIDRMKDILKAENIAYEDPALNLIARAAEGSMRDALSILDQVISFSGLKVTATAVRESIGLIGTELIFSLLKNVLERDAKDALQIVQNAFNQGVDLKVLLKSLIEMLHALILIQVGIEKPETHFSDDELKQLAQLKTSRLLEENELIFQVYHHGLELLSRAAQPKLIFDLLVIKTALAEGLVRLENGESESHESSRTTSSTPISSPRREARLEVASVAPIQEKPLPTNTEAFPLAPVSPTPAQTGEEHAPASALTSKFSFHTEAKLEIQAAAPKAAVHSGPKTWDQFIEFTYAQKPVLGIVLESVVEWTLPENPEQKLKLGFREKDRTKADQISQKAFRDQFLQLTESFFGFKCAPEVFFSQNNGESVAEKSERVEKESRELKMKSILSHEIVQEAKSLFGVELTQIEMIERGS